MAAKGNADPEPAFARLAALAERRADGRMAQGFSAGDDHGVEAGSATIRLDLDAIDRRFGLTPEPEPREALVLDLPLPAAGQRRQVTGTLAADLSRHPWANLPVTVSLEVRDGIDQAGRAQPVAMILPGRRFFDPLAAALILLPLGQGSTGWFVLAALVGERRDLDRVLIVGHNPGLERLVALMTEGTSSDYRGMPPAGIAVLGFPREASIEPGVASLNAFWWP